MSIFGMEQFGMTEQVSWSKLFDAWLVQFTKDGWSYERLIEENPRHLSESIKKFYRDDAVYTMNKELS